MKKQQTRNVSPYAWPESAASSQNSAIPVNHVRRKIFARPRGLGSGDKSFNFVHECSIDYNSEYVEVNTKALQELQPQEHYQDPQSKDPLFSLGSISADVKATPESYMFIVDIPGIKSSEVKVQIENRNTLKIIGERKRDHKSSSLAPIKYIRLERPAGTFMRKFNLPPNAHIEKIAASCRSGQLTVVIPKKPHPPPLKPKTVDIAITEQPLGLQTKTKLTLK